MGLLPPAGYADCVGNMSSSSFFLSFFLLSGNTSFSHTFQHPILTKLDHNDRYHAHYSGTKDGGVRDHDGITGVKKIIFTKKASSPTNKVPLTRDLCMCISLTPSTKDIGLENHLGSLGSKVNFHQKGINSKKLYSIDA